jgi:hypothetical protein
MVPPGRHLRQAAWFVALWLGGVMAVTLLAWLIRWWLFPG